MGGTNTTLDYFITNTISTGVPLLIDLSDATTKLQKIDNAVAQSSAKIDQNKLKLIQLWSYGNQLISLVLTNLKRGFKGTAQEAAVQEALAGVQIAQSEYAVVMTQKQAATAFLTKQWVQAFALEAIALSMQAGIILAQINKASAQEAKRQAEELRDNIEAYR